MRDTTLSTHDRGLSREGLAAIGFGLTIVMIATAGGLLMQTGDSLSDGGPMVSTSTTPVYAGDDADSQWVRIKHESGKNVAVKNVDVVVDLPDHRKRARLHSLPTEGIRQTDYDGNHVFTRGEAGIDGVIDADTGGDGNWSAGDVVAFRIEHSRVALEPGQTVTVTIRHTESETTLAERKWIVKEK